MQLSAGRFETKEINVELFMIIAFQKKNRWLVLPVDIMFYDHREA